MRLVHSNRFEANKWLVSARWFYAPAIFVMGLLSKLDPQGFSVFPLPVMIFLFSLFILVNVIFWMTAKKLELQNKTKQIGFLGFSQILAELIFFLFIFHFSGGIESVAPIFFFIPVVSSIILFNHLGSMIVAFIAGIIVNGMVILEYFGIIQRFYGYAGSGNVSYEELLVKLSSSVVIAAVYFIVAALSGYLSAALKRREMQVLEDNRRTKFQAEKLRLLNEEYNKFARRLIRKDLELRKENQEMNRLDEEKKEFVSTVAHQLRTPLSAIKWTLDILLQETEGKLTSDQRVLIMKAYESNERIINLIQDMLGSERAEAKAGNFSPVEISLPDLVDNIIPEFEPNLERRNLKVEVQKQKDLPKIKADPQKMRVVFQNLIENAAKYSKKGTRIKIYLAINKNDPTKLETIIEDQGIGIPKDEQDKIFKKFFRAQNAVKIESSGSGLGLFIVKSIIERHGGTISFESQENKGTKFILNLPIASK